MLQAAGGLENACKTTIYKRKWNASVLTIAQNNGGAVAQHLARWFPQTGVLGLNPIRDKNFWSIRYEINQHLEGFSLGTLASSRHFAKCALKTRVYTEHKKGAAHKDIETWRKSSKQISCSITFYQPFTYQINCIWIFYNQSIHRYSRQKAKKIF